MSHFAQANRGRASLKENQAPKNGKVGFPMDTKSKGVNRRTVLGSISNNVRVQPSRAAKDTIKTDFQDENACAKLHGKKTAGKNQPFSIFVDAEPLPKHAPIRKPLADVHTKMQGEELENHLPVNIMDLPGIADVHHRTMCASAANIMDMSVEHEEYEEAEDEAIMLEAAENVVPADVQSVRLVPTSTFYRNEISREAMIEEVPEYADEIYDYLLKIEMKHRPDPGFMSRQEDITLHMRCILIDWLVEVAEEYRLQRETLFLTVSYIDRFLASMSVKRPKLQLVGASAMFLASKYEEIYPPDVGEFVYITDDTYTKKQILRMEHMILNALKFDMSTPTINWFVERILKHALLQDSVKNMAMFLCELVLVDMDKFLKFPNSVIAASAVCLAFHTFREPIVWTADCLKVTRYWGFQLEACLQVLNEQLINSSRHPQQAVREKYKQTKYGRVAELHPNQLPIVFGSLHYPQSV